LVLFSLNLFFVSVWLLLVMLWRCWGWCGLVLMALAARPRRLYRSCSRSSFLLFVGEEDDDLLSVVMCYSSPSSSCGYVATEIGDFPSASLLPGESRFSPALGGRGGGRAAARLRSASAVVEEWIRDLVVISIFFEVFCTASKG
jgi:hypothetical protein